MGRGGRGGGRNVGDQRRVGSSVGVGWEGRALWENVGLAQKMARNVMLDAG